MALIREYQLKNGLSAPNAYHVVVKVDTLKRVSDDPDPGGARPVNAPNYIWKAGYYGRACVAIYASKEAREAGYEPIGMKSVYPTGTPYGFAGSVDTSDDMNFEIDLASPLNEVEQAYAHIKTLPYYQDAVED
jgi:hypothetical protein